MSVEPKRFNTEQEAADWMYEVVDDPYVDNHRFSYEDDPAGMLEYKKQEARGCCGSFDDRVIVAGRPAMIGCNYGH